MIEFVRPPVAGRLFTSEYHVRLADADTRGAIQRSFDRQSARGINSSSTR